MSDTALWAGVSAALVGFALVVTVTCAWRCQRRRRVVRRRQTNSLAQMYPTHPQHLGNAPHQVTWTTGIPPPQQTHWHVQQPACMPQSATHCHCAPHGTTHCCPHGQPQMAARSLESVASTTIASMMSPGNTPVVFNGGPTVPYPGYPWNTLYTYNTILIIGLSTGIGAIAILLTVAVLCVYYCRKKTPKDEQKDATTIITTVTPAPPLKSSQNIYGNTPVDTCQHTCSHTTPVDTCHRTCGNTPQCTCTQPCPSNNETHLNIVVRVPGAPFVPATMTSGQQNLPPQQNGDVIYPPSPRMTIVRPLIVDNQDGGLNFPGGGATPQRSQAQTSNFLQNYIYGGTIVPGNGIPYDTAYITPKRSQAQPTNFPQNYGYGGTTVPGNGFPYDTAYKWP